MPGFLPGARASRPRRALRLGASAALAVLLALAPSAVRADEPSSQPGLSAEEREERSRALFDEARKLAEAGRWSEVCPVLQAAHALNATGGTAFQLANCYERIGEPDKALPLWRFILERRDQMPAERVQIAESRIEAAKKREEAAKGAEPEVGEGSGASKDERKGAQPPSVPEQRAAVAEPPKEAPSRVPAYVAFGVGGAGLAVGTIFGLLTLSEASEIKDDCLGDRCDPNDAGAASSARTKGWASTIGFGVGIAGAVTGAVLLLTAPGSSPKATGAAARRSACARTAWASASELLGTACTDADISGAPFRCSPSPRAFAPATR